MSGLTLTCLGATFAGDYLMVCSTDRTAITQWAMEMLALKAPRASTASRRGRPGFCGGKTLLTPPTL